MKGVMAMASQKVEEYTKENPNWKTNNWQQNENDRNGHYQDFNQENRGWNSSTGIGQFKTGSSSWDDAKDDGYDNFYESASNKNAVGHNGKSDSTWTEGGFL